MFQKFRSLDLTMEFDIKRKDDYGDEFNVGSALKSSYYLDIALFQHLFDRHLDLSLDDNSALRHTFFSAYAGNFQIFCKLLEDPRVDPSVDDNMAIRVAYQNGYFDIVCKLLEDPRVDPSADDNKSICFASQNGYFDKWILVLDIIMLLGLHLKMVIWMLFVDRRYGGPSADNNYAIKKAREKGHLEVVNRLLLDVREKTLMQAYIRIIYQNHNYGPLNVPSKLRDICEGLRINERAIPALLKISPDFNYIPQLTKRGRKTKSEYSQIDNDDVIESKSVQITDLDAEILEGVYELYVAHPEIPYVNYKENLTKNYSQNLSVMVSSGTQTMIFDIVETNNNIDENYDGETPLPIEEIQASVEAMKYVIASIPTRYVKYNAILSRNIDKATRECTRLSLILEKGIRLNSLLSPEIRKTLIYYQMMQVMVNAWNSVWIKFGPNIRTYHQTDLKSVDALSKAEHFINRFHVWRRVMEEDKWNLIQTEVLTDRVTHPSYISRVNGYNPPYLHLSRSFGNPTHPMIYVSTSNQTNAKEPDFKTARRVKSSNVSTSMAMQTQTMVEIEKKPSYSEGVALKKFRRIFVSTLAKTQVYRDHEMNQLLEELLSFQGPNLNDENLVIDHRFPTHYVRSRIKKEFKLDEWMEKTRTKTDPELQKISKIDAECQTESRSRALIKRNGSFASTIGFEKGVGPNSVEFLPKNKSFGTNTRLRMSTDQISMSSQQTEQSILDLKRNSVCRSFSSTLVNAKDNKSSRSKQSQGKWNHNPLMLSSASSILQYNCNEKRRFKEGWEN